MLVRGLLSLDAGGVESLASVVPVPGLVGAGSGTTRGEWTAPQDELLVLAIEEVRAGFWEQVAKKLSLVGGGTRSAEECAGRFAGVRGVEG